MLLPLLVVDWLLLLMVVWQLRCHFSVCPCLAFASIPPGPVPQLLLYPTKRAPRRQAVLSPPPPPPSASHVAPYLSCPVPPFSPKGAPPTRVYWWTTSRISCRVPCGLCTASRGAAGGPTQRRRRGEAVEKASRRRTHIGEFRNGVFFFCRCWTSAVHWYVRRT